MLIEFAETVVHLKQGDRIYIYSDGVPEAMNEKLEQFTKERMLKIITQSRSESLDNSVSSLLGAVNDWCEQRGPIDDVSILGLEIRKSD